MALTTRSQPFEVRKNSVDIGWPQIRQPDVTEPWYEVDADNRFMLASSCWRPSVRLIHPPLEVGRKPDTARDRCPGVAESQQLGELGLGLVP